MRRGIAYHEAGHAVVGTRLGLEVTRTDMVPDGAGGRGHTKFAQPWAGFGPRAGRLTARDRDMIERFAVTFMGGFAAEARHGHPSTDGSGYDERDVLAGWIALLTDDEAERLTMAAAYLERAGAILAGKREWEAVTAIAEGLLRAGSMSGSEVRALISPGR